jgi:hypothetical protein
MFVGEASCLSSSNGRTSGVGTAIALDAKVAAGSTEAADVFVDGIRITEVANVFEEDPGFGLAAARLHISSGMKTLIYMMVW